MADRIYVTYTPTGVPGSFHTAIHYQRTGQHGDVIEHLIIEAGPENKDLPPEKIIGVIEEAMREGDEPLRFGSIQAKIRERRAADLTEAASDDPNAPYEVIAEANDLSENVARMQLYALGFNRAGFAYRGDRQNSNTFAGAALSAGKLPAATGVAHDPIGRPGELSEFFVPGLNEPLRTPIGRRSSDEPNVAPALREAKYKIPAFPEIPVSTFAKEAPAQTPVFQTDNASTIGGIGKFIGDRLMATGGGAIVDACGVAEPHG